MTWLFLALLALVQGITEFLPVSSSAHLVLLPQLMGWHEQPLSVDVAIHLGSLFAIIYYFFSSFLNLGVGAKEVISGQFGSDNAKELICLGVASLPIIFAGFMLKDWVAGEARNVHIIAWMVIIFGVVLFIADKKANNPTKSTVTRLRDASWVGVAQVLALVPGVSRSGITMTALLWLGYDRVSAARFSMLLAVPTIIGASVLIGVELVNSGSLEIQLQAIYAGGMSFVAAFITITLFMSLLQKITLLPFVLYRLVLGGFLLAWVYSGTVLTFYG